MAKQTVAAGQKRSLISGSSKVEDHHSHHRHSKNPKIEALVDAIVNDSIQPVLSKKLSPAQKFKNIMLKKQGVRSEKPFETDEEVEISDKRIKGIAMDNVRDMKIDNVRSMDIDGIPIPLQKDIDLDNIKDITVDNVDEVDISDDESSEDDDRWR